MKVKQLTILFCLVLFGSQILAQKIGDAYEGGLIAIQRGIELFDRGEYDSAIVEYKKVDPCDSNYHYALYEMALAYSNSKQYSKAIAACVAGLKMNSSEERGFYDILGSTYDYMDKQDSSIYYYKFGMSKFPYYHKYYFETAVSYIGKKNDSAALRYLIKSATLNPVHAGTHLQLAELAARNGHPTEAMLAYQYFFAIENGGKRAMAALGNFQKMCNDNFPQADKPIQLYSTQGFSELDEIIKSRAAQIESYKTKVKLKYTDVIKQCQIISEKYVYSEKDNGFYNQFYGKVWSKVWAKDYFVPSMYFMFAGINSDEVQEMVKKNEKDIANYVTYFYDVVREHAKKVKHTINGKEVEGDRHFYKSGNIEAVGVTDANNKQVGKWYLYYSNGVLKSEGNYVNGEADGVWTGYYDNGAKKNENNWSKGKRNGTYKMWYTNGRLKEVGVYNNDILEGEVIGYSSTGALKEKANYKNNVQHGKYTSYNYLGLKKIEATFDNDKVNGLVTDFYENGKISELRNFKMGVTNGNTKGYYRSGKLEFIGSYKNGKRDSMWVWYYENGKKLKEGEFKEDKRVGKWTEYYDNGKIETITTYNKNEEIDGEVKEYNRKGQLYTDAKYKDDEMLYTNYYGYDQKIIYENKNKNKKGTFLSKRYHMNGNLDEVGSYKDGKKDGVFSTYFRNGAKYAEATLKDGVYEGSNVRYYATGQINEEFACKGDEFDGYFKTYYANGKLKTEGYYKMGALEGPYMGYYKDGTLKEKFYYRNDELTGYGDFYDVKGRLAYRNHYSDITISKTEYFDTLGVLFDTAVLDKDSSDIVTKYPNGKVREKYKTKYGKINGPYVEYHTNGKIRRSATYTYGFLNGEFNEYDVEGKLISTEMYVDNKQNGEEKGFTDGKLDYSNDYVNNQQTGKKRYYYENGKVYSERQYLNDRIDSLNDYFGEDGSFGLRVYYDEDEVISYTYPDKNKQNVPVILLKNETGPVVSYYANGQKSREMTYKLGNLEGKRIAYYTNGNKYLECEYVSDERVGSNKEYYINGKLKYDQQMKNGELNGIEKTYYDTGTIKTEIYWVNDRKNGTARYYDKTGKLVKTLVFVNGYAYEK